MKKLILSSIAFTVLAASHPALANHQTDMKGYKDYKGEANAWVPMWNGFYLGVNGGYGWSNQYIVMSADTTSGPPSGQQAITDGALPSNLAKNPSGGLAGAQVGYNHQFYQAVVGLEADLQWANISASQTITTNVTPTYFQFTTSGNQKLSRFGTIRGRLGATPLEALLLYITGGFAYGRESMSTTITNPGCVGVCSSKSTSGNVYGWVIGAGGEYALNSHWSLKGEYLFLDMGRMSQLNVDPKFATTSFTRQQLDMKDNILRAGLNYKFM